MEKTNTTTTTTIETPIVIQIEQLKYTLSKAIQDSKLPIFIINPILKDLFQESNLLLQEYTKQELEKYQQANNNEIENTSTDEVENK